MCVCVCVFVLVKAYYFVMNVISYIVEIEYFNLSMQYVGQVVTMTTDMVSNDHVECGKKAMRKDICERLFKIS